MVFFFFKKRVFLRFDTHNDLGILGFAEVLSQKIVVWVFKKVYMFGRYLVTNL